MAYQIDRYNNTLLTVVEDGTIDQTTDLKFIGRNYAGYGEIQNENLLFLLESFSSPTEPPRPLSGQVWFDSASKKLKFYDGTIFRTTGGAEIGPSEPAGLTTGDFWWNTTNNQLYAYNGSDFTLVGPQAAPGAGLTQMQSATVTDTNSNSRTIIKGVIDDVVVFIISNTEFTLSGASAIPNFSLVKKGLTLVNTNTSGITSNDYFWWGTASDSLRLNGLPASNYVLASNPNFTTAVNFSDAGFTVGNSFDLKVFIENDNQGVIQNDVGNSNLIKFKANNSGGSLIHSVSVTATGINPAANSTFNLGTASVRWNNVFADTFNGLATTAGSVRLSSTDYQPSLGAVNNTVALRDSSGNITANIFNGIATSARFADLAEKYTVDKDYSFGTVMAVGGDAETTAANAGDVVIGVISESPAFLMNVDCEGLPIALKGRVPVRIVGAVTKGQAVYIKENGVASTEISSGLVGVALETNASVEEKLVECVLKV
jgi:hypothetical protein